MNPSTDLHRADPVEFPFHKPRPHPPKRAAIRALVFIGLGLFMGHRMGQSMGYEWIGAGGGLLLGVLVALFFYLRGRLGEEPAPVITFSGQRVSLPRSAFKLRADWVPVRDILSLERIGSRGAGQLLIRAPARTYGYPIVLLGGEEVARALREEVLRRFSNEPDGPKLMRAIAEREDASDRLFAHEPKATRAILFVLFAIFAVSSLLGAYDDSNLLDGHVILLRLGASAPKLVLDGDWYRLVTANLLHGGMIHIGFNGLAILGLGYIVERLMGTPRFLVLYLLTGVTGTVASVYLSGSLLSVGASTSVFGLFVAWAYATLRFSRRLPAGFAMTRFQWGILLLNFLLPVLIPFIDGWGHAGGALGGLVVAAILFPSAASFDRAWGSDHFWWAIAGALIAVYVGAAAVAYRSDREDPLVRRDLLELALRSDSESRSPNDLNNLAWMIAIDPGATSDEVEVATQLAQRAVDGAAGVERGAFLDTLATTFHRAGDDARAVRTELEALGVDRLDQTTLWSQLGRFLEGYERQHGEIYGAGLVATATVAVRGNGLDVRTGSGGTWYFAVDANNAPAGMIMMRLPDAMNTRLPVSEVPSGANIRVLGTTDVSGSATAEFHSHDTVVDSYP